MSLEKPIVLDANILIRAVLGQRVRHLIVQHADRVQFFAPDAAYADARKYLPALLEKRGIPTAPALAVLDAVAAVVQEVPLMSYQHWQTTALQRIATRDANDWPILACALALSCPIWTEDADFFGTGVATWTSDRVMWYFS
jgi:predicted nucleic acid-binding protein